MRERKREGEASRFALKALQYKIKSLFFIEWKQGYIFYYMNFIKNKEKIYFSVYA